MNKCDDRLAASILYMTSARNKTAENAEGRGGSIKQPMRTSAHSAVNNKEDQPQRTQRVVVFLCVLCGFPNPFRKIIKSLRNQF